MVDTTETAWLIERKNISDEPIYWDGRDRNSFSTDHDRAIRFARRVDANVVLKFQLGGIGEAVEHMWCDMRGHMAVWPKFGRSRKALVEYDRTRALVSQTVTNLNSTNEEIERADRLCDAALYALLTALYEDTKDRNSLDSCRYVPVSQIRRWIKEEDERDEEARRATGCTA